jgi:hypothetical protein
MRRQRGNAKFRSCTQQKIRAITATVTMSGIDLSDMASSSASGGGLSAISFRHSYWRENAANCAMEMQRGPGCSILNEISGVGIYGTISVAEAKLS